MTFEATHLGGVLALCTSEGGQSSRPSDPDRALRALLAPGTSTIVALDTDGECGFGEPGPAPGDDHLVRPTR